MGNETNIPYTRVNHNKYMVTHNVAYVGEWWTSKMFNLLLYKFHNVTENKNQNCKFSFFFISAEWYNHINQSIISTIYFTLSILTNVVSYKSWHLTRLYFTGTSNWSADYFNTTAGVGLVLSQHVLRSPSPESTLVGQLNDMFDRDWSSKFAVPLENLAHNPDCAFSKT